MYVPSWQSCFVISIISAVSLVNVGPYVDAFAPPLRHQYPVTSVESLAWAVEKKLAQEHAQTHSLFSAVGSYLRSSTDESGSRASCSPFVIRCGSSDSQMITFGTDEIRAAVSADYLDAGEGSTNPDKGWRMQPVGDSRRGRSFQGSRLSFSDITNAKGTVIFNSAGAYISSTLSASSLAALDGMDGSVFGVGLNMYVTRGDAEVSAPPHTDKQDVVVVQTQGRKHWRVFSPPDNQIKSSADPFSRGKGMDDLPVENLESSVSKLLLEVTLNPGDVLFVPARFPHTTDTLSCYSDKPDKVFGLKDWSVHLTVGLDSHVWSMNYLSMRRVGLRRFGIQDVLMMQDNDDWGTYNDNECVGEVNNLSKGLREALFSSVDGSLLSVKDDITKTVLGAAVEKVAMDLFLMNERVNDEFGGNVGIRQNGNKKDATLSLAQCVITVMQFRSIGRKILKTHTDMYIAAVEEEGTRMSEEGGWTTGEDMSQEQIDRLSIFRVPVFFEQLDEFRDELRTWADEYGGGLGVWAANQSIMNGDQVESNLGGICWSPAKVVDARADGLFDLQLFDGRVEKGVKRDAMKGPHGIGVFI